ncbi:hypothetical protein AB1Y20_018361 [Prymnesium parvum]|uniref:Uncharacterized protein n=1 Tax=Prymnesium parvum TaxID=97485 RepID=A0AB34JPD1_PRYPA
MAPASPPAPSSAPPREPLRLSIPDSSALSFSDACLGDDGVRELCASLHTRAHVRSLDLRGNHLHAEGVAALAQLLLTGPSRIDSISLEWNSIGTSDAGARALATALAATSSLTHLDLRNNKLGPTCCAPLADALVHNHSLLTLDFRWNSAGPTGGHALAEGLERNSTLLRLPLQGNRVAEETLRRIEGLLARNGALVLPSGGENEEPNAPGGGAAHEKSGALLRSAVRTRTLEGAISAQQAEFAHKVHNLRSRLDAAELAVTAERARADSIQAQLEAAEEAASEARQAEVLAQQEEAAAKEQAGVEVKLAQQEAANATHRELAAKAALELMRENLAARDRRIEAELRAIADREERAQQAEARAAETASELAALNARLLEERRAHTAEQARLQDRISEQTRLRTDAEHEVAQAQQAQAVAVAVAQKKQADMYEAMVEKLKAEAAHKEQQAERATVAVRVLWRRKGGVGVLQCSTALLSAQLEAHKESVARAIATAEDKARQAVDEVAQLRLRMQAELDARDLAAEAAKEELMRIHREDLKKQHATEAERWQQQEAKLTACREEKSALENQLAKAEASFEHCQRENLHFRESLQEERRTIDALKEQLDQAKQAAQKQHMEHLEETAAARKTHEELQARASAESTRLAGLVRDLQREVQSERNRWETALQAGHMGTAPLLTKCVSCPHSNFHTRLLASAQSLQQKVNAEFQSTISNVSYSTEQ